LPGSFGFIQNGGIDAPNGVPTENFQPPPCPSWHLIVVQRSAHYFNLVITKLQQLKKRCISIESLTFFAAAKYHVTFWPGEHGGWG
jgi:hypothetical protein